MSVEPNGLSEQERFQVEAAWLYHIEGLTQGKIAEHLGVTRLRVNRALGEARRSGIVRVEINSPFSPCLHLEAEFKARYHLDEVSIAPKPADENSVVAVIGAELGRYLSVVLGDPKVKLVGVAWGRAINRAARAVMPCPRPDLEIVSIMGGLPEGSEVNAFEIVTRLSQRFSSKRTFFTAPLYASTEQSRDTILIQDVFQEVLAKIRRADVMVMGAGGNTMDSLLMHGGLPKDITPESLLRAGAVGDILGYFFDQDGSPIDHPINRRVIGLNPLTMRDVPKVILAAGGQHKVPVITAALKMKVFNVLITDQCTAESVLALGGA